MILPDLDARHRQPELMDAPSLAPAQRAGALRALARVNALSCVALAFGPGLVVEAVLFG